MAFDQLLDSFARVLARAPDRPLVLSPARRATAADVDAMALALAARLRALALPPGSLVALAAPNGPGFLAAWLAVRRAQLVPVLHDAATPAKERARIAADLGAAATITAPAWPSATEDFSTRYLAPRQALPDEGVMPTGTGPVGPPPKRLAPEESASAGGLRLLPVETAAVKLTSGSTGRPKGIVTPTAALEADTVNLATTMGLRDGDRLLAMVPLSHSYGLSSLAMPALAFGWPLVVAEDRGPFAPLHAAAACGATFLPTVPAWLGALTRLAEPPEFPASLRLVISAGAPLGAETAERFRASFGQPVHVFYGASECGGICYDREGGAAERGTVGTPVDGVTVTLDGDSGLVAVRSAAVAAGTIPEPDARLADGRFTAGDLAEWDGGELRLRGRADDLVIVKGKKVNPREVEALLRQLPEVEDVAVLGVPKPGTGEPTLRAVIACRTGALSYEAVVAWCRGHLAEHKVPRHVVFVAELPRTARGKLDRGTLAAL